MKRKLSALVAFVFILALPALALAVEGFKFTPVAHASVGVQIEGFGLLYVDPVGDSPVYSKLGEPAAILVTHIHGDHLDKKRLAALKTASTVILGPESVIKELGYGEVLRVGEARKLGALTVEAVAAYNLTPARQDYHPKSRGDAGYVLEMAAKRVYFSGDTEATPEMRALKKIDHAFVCMNLPYTMGEEDAADGVKAFRPKVVTPYHYRSKDTGVSDLKTFKSLMATEKDIKVEELAFY